MEGVTPGDIRKKYIDTYGEKIKADIQTCVDHINKRLLEDCVSICKENYTLVYMSGINFTSNESHSSILEYIRDIYKDWKITESGSYYHLSAKNRIDSHLDLDFQDKPKAVTSEEVIEKREEILDLEQE